MDKKRINTDVKKTPIHLERIQPLWSNNTYNDSPAWSRTPPPTSYAVLPDLVQRFGTSFQKWCSGSLGQGCLEEGKVGVRLEARWVACRHHRWRLLWLRRVTRNSKSRRIAGERTSCSSGVHLRHLNRVTDDGQSRLPSMCTCYTFCDRQDHAAPLGALKCIVEMPRWQSWEFVPSPPKSQFLFRKTCYKTCGRAGKLEHRLHSSRRQIVPELCWTQVRWRRPG